MKISVVIPAGGSFCWNYAIDTFYSNYEVPASVTIIQFLRFYCNYVGGTFCYICFGGSFWCNYAIMQLDVSTPFMQVEVSAANMWATLFIEIMHVELSVTIMQVVFSTVHYAHGYLYCNYAGD